MNKPDLRLIDPPPPEPIGPSGDDCLSFRGGRPAELLIRGAHVLDPVTGIDEPLDLLVRDGEIAELGKELTAPEGCEVLDARGAHVFPGFVDPHVHLRTPGFEYKEDLATGTAAAAAGGFVAVIAMANTNPPVDSAAAIASLRAHAELEARVPVAFSATVSKGMRGEELSEMAELAEAGAICFTDDGLPIVDAGLMRQALQYQRLAGRPIALHEEDPRLTRGGVMHEGAVSARLGFAGYPGISESTMIARDALIAEYEGGSIHVQHLSCVGSIHAVAAAKARGVKITTEVTPHHLTLTDEAIGDGTDANFKMNPPLRSEADRQALIAALKDGTIDIIATDHAPHAAHEKEVPLEQAAMGVTGLETSFPVVYTDLVKPGVLDLSTLVDRLSRGAELFDITRPKIAVGEKADLCVFDLEREFEVGENGYASRSSNCCFAGRSLSGAALLTLAGGVEVFRARSLAVQEVGG
jgi:dihydroorotase